MADDLNGWNKRPTREGTREILRLHKRYPDDPDVQISVLMTTAGYEVRSSAESRTSGPNDTVVGIFQSASEANEVAENECRDWDAYIIGGLSSNLKDVKLIVNPND